MKIKPRIYDYFDYREFLRDYFAFERSRKVSQRTIAKKIGVSAAYFTMVLSRKRNLDLSYLEAMSDLINLNVSERSYFKNLIIVSDSQDSNERSSAYKALSKFRSYRTKRAADVVTHRYLDNWYYVAIRELSFLPDFKEDPEWIKNRFLPKLKQREIEQALGFLKKNELLASNNQKALDCSEHIYKLSLTNYHQGMLDIAKDSIELVKREERSILGFTKSMSKANFGKAREIMQNAIYELEQLEESEGGELFQFYLLGFPLTKKEIK